MQSVQHKLTLLNEIINEWKTKLSQILKLKLLTQAWILEYFHNFQ